MKDERLINRYLDGEVNKEEKEYVDKRLLTDQVFADKFQKFLEVEKLLSKISNDIVPDDIYQRVINSVKYQERRLPFFKRYAPTLVGSMMSFVLGILFTSFVFTNQSSGLSNTINNSDNLYSSLEIDDVMNYYYGD